MNMAFRRLQQRTLSSKPYLERAFISARVSMALSCRRPCDEQSLPKPYGRARRILALARRRPSCPGTRLVTPGLVPTDIDRGPHRGWRITLSPRRAPPNARRGRGAG
jgi:hypothetical protein